MSEKRKYIVNHITVQRDGGCEYSRNSKEYTTYAVSKAKAVNNIMYRLGYNQYNVYSEGYGDYNQEHFFEAREA